MANRVALAKETKKGGAYFAAPKKNVPFIPSGSKLLDLALGGGWARHRVANIVGDKSTGKTLLCIEAAANFAHTLPKGKIRYREAEAAFDIPYAQALGLPIDRVDFGPKGGINTVEALFKDLKKIIDGAHEEELVFVDSLDALSDEAELARDFDEGTYGAQKAKNLSKMFRMLVRDLAQSKVTLIVVSQIRDKMNVAYGKKVQRSGGHAMDFYCSQVVWLSHTGRLTKQVHGIKRAYGVKIEAFVEKNKVGTPFREAEFKIIFGYGMDDAESCLSWLKESKGLKALGISDYKEHLGEMDEMSDNDFRAELTRIHEYVSKRWWEIEGEFLPTRRKYG